MQGGSDRFLRNLEAPHWQWNNMEIQNNTLGGKIIAKGYWIATGEVKDIEAYKKMLKQMRSLLHNLVQNS